MGKLMQKFSNPKVTGSTAGKDADLKGRALDEAEKYLNARLEIENKYEYDYVELNDSYKQQLQQIENVIAKNKKEGYETKIDDFLRGSSIYADAVRRAVRSKADIEQSFKQKWNELSKNKNAAINKLNEECLFDVFDSEDKLKPYYDKELRIYLLPHNSLLFDCGEDNIVAKGSLAVVGKLEQNTRHCGEGGSAIEVFETTQRAKGGRKEARDDLVIIVSSPTYNSININEGSLTARDGSVYVKSKRGDITIEDCKVESGGGLVIDGNVITIRRDTINVKNDIVINSPCSDNEAVKLMINKITVGGEIKGSAVVSDRPSFYQNGNEVSSLDKDVVTWQ